MVLSFRGWKPSRILVASVLLFASVVPVLKADDAKAAILGNRLIRLSSSANGSISDGQGVTYHVEFDIGTTGNLEGIVVDFCAVSPIIGDPNCDKTTSPSQLVPDLDGSGDSLSVSGYSTGGAGEADLQNFTTHTIEGAGDSTITLTYATGVSVTSGDTAYFDITSVDNPETTNSAFFARIYTFSDSTIADAYTVASPGSFVDAGGIALSTAEQVIVTAKVAERLVFCVYVDDEPGGLDPPDPGTENDCDGKAGSAIDLGDANGVLDPNGEFINKEAYYSVTTNASGSVAINLRGKTLENGSNDIDAIGATPDTTQFGTEQFGLCNYEYASIDSNIVPTAAKYDGNGSDPADCENTSHNSGTATAGSAAGNADFAFDLAAIDSTYGDTIAVKPAGNFSTANMVFIANISNTTVAGIYTTTLTFIATGTY